METPFGGPAEGNFSRQKKVPKVPCRVWGDQETPGPPQPSRLCKHPASYPPGKQSLHWGGPAGDNILSKKDEAAGQRKGGSEAEGKSQRRQPSKGLINSSEALLPSMSQADRQTAVAGLERPHPLMYRSKERTVMESTQGDTVTVGMMCQQAMEADPNTRHTQRPWKRALPQQQDPCTGHREKQARVREQAAHDNFLGETKLKEYRKK